MVFSNIRQMAYFCEPDAFDATVEYWQQVGGVGPFWTAVVRPENQIYRGQPTDGEIETAMGWLGHVQVEVIRPLNDAPSPWTDWRTPGLVIAPAGFYHHFMIETDDFDGTKAKLLAGGATEGLTADPPGGGRFAYLDARSTFGCWIELQQRERFREILTEMMKEITREWDGSQPRRSYFELMEQAQEISSNENSER